MTKAQQIRNRRLERLENNLTVEAKKIFDWILDLIDVDTQKGYFRSLDLCLFNDQWTIKTTALDGTEYCLEDDFFFTYDRLQFFNRLKEVIEQEEGFKAVIKPNSDFWNSEATIFKVVIE